MGCRLALQPAPIPAFFGASAKMAGKLFSIVERRRISRRSRTPPHPEMPSDGLVFYLTTLLATLYDPVVVYGLTFGVALIPPLNHKHSPAENIYHN